MGIGVYLQLPERFQPSRQLALQVSHCTYKVGDGGIWLVVQGKHDGEEAFDRVRKAQVEGVRP